MPAELLVLVDTGADTTTLPFNIASMLGFSTSELESTVTNAVGGKATTWKPKVQPPGVDVEIGGQWYALPALAFADKTPPLFGRDFVFQHFRLRMEHGETELKPK